MLFRRKLIVLLAFVGCIIWLPTFSKADEGVHAPCDAADSYLDKLKDWDNVYFWFKNFPKKCDDGSLAEGINDSVVKLLVHDWQNFPRLVKLANQDDAFKKFILRHINEEFYVTLMKI